MPGGDVDTAFDVELNGQMDPYGWGINGRKFGDHEPLEVSVDRRVRMSMTGVIHCSAGGGVVTAVSGVPAQSTGAVANRMAAFAFMLVCGVALGWRREIERKSGHFRGTRVFAR